MILERPSVTCCISQYSLGVNFTDSDAGIYSKGVRDVRASCVAGEVVHDTQLRQYSSSHSRSSFTPVQLTTLVMPKIRTSIDYVMITFFLLGYPSNDCAVRIYAATQKPKWAKNGLFGETFPPHKFFPFFPSSLNSIELA